MSDRYRSANRPFPAHAPSASGPAGGPEARHVPAPNLMFVPDGAPAHPERASRSVWRFGRYIAVYSVLALAFPPIGAAVITLLAG